MAGDAGNFQTLKDACLQDGRLYEDPDFPAIDKSIYFSKGVSKHVRWKRPPAIVDSPKFIKDGATRFDLDQGSLGNCWFVAAVNTLASKPELLHQVVPTEQGFDPKSYAGIFHFRFWRYGEWQEVVVDDRLPVKYGRFLLFGQNREDPNEFWCALLEKAYAKLFGSYEALETGKIQDALVDMTAGVGEVIQLQDKARVPRSLFRTMVNIEKANSLMGCSIARPGSGGVEQLSNGLYTGHAYSINRLVTVESNRERVRLIRLRNPWGKGEWNGNWSDGAAIWETVPDSSKKKLKLDEKEDGEFWMDFNDWRSSFSELQLCHMTPQSSLHPKGKEDWNMEACHGTWVRGVSAGGCGMPPKQELYWSNPQYHVEVTETPDGQDTVLFSVLQKDARISLFRSGTDTGPRYIGYALFRVKTEALLSAENYADKAEMLDSSYLPYREVASQVTLTPGHYCVIPTTYYPDQEAEFVLRVLSHSAVKLKELDHKTGPSPQYTPKSSPSEYVLLGESPTPKRRGTEDLTIEEKYQELAGDKAGLDHKDLLIMLTTRVLSKVGKPVPMVDDIDQTLCRTLIFMITKGRNTVLKWTRCEKLFGRLQNWMSKFGNYDNGKCGRIPANVVKDLHTDIGQPIDQKTKKTIVDFYGGPDEMINTFDFVTCAARIQIVMDRQGRSDLAGLEEEVEKALVL